MLYIPGRESEHDRILDGILSRSSMEYTPEGFLYYVADPDENMGLTTGVVYRDPERSELTLVVNGQVRPNDRLKIAQTAVDAETEIDRGRYWLAAAVSHNLSWEDDSDFSENIDVINMMQTFLREQLKFIMSDPAVKPEDKRRISDEGRSAIGMLATLTGINDEGKDAFAEFSAQGLWVPHSEVDKSELQGFMQTPRGTERVRFIMMPEKSERHNCANCSAHILPGTNRVTLGLDRHDGYSNHHHYHFPCFVSYVLPRIDLRTVEPTPARFA